MTAVLTKKSGALEEESVWEAYWLAAPGGKDPPHHTFQQHLPQDIHLNAIWQPSAISKQNLNIDFDIQFQRWKTLFRFYTHSQTLRCLSCWKGPLLRPYTVRGASRGRLSINSCFLKFLAVVCRLFPIKLCITWPPHKVINRRKPRVEKWKVNLCLPSLTTELFLFLILKWSQINSKLICTKILEQSWCCSVLARECFVWVLTLKGRNIVSVSGSDLRRQ